MRADTVSRNAALVDDLSVGVLELVFKDIFFIQKALSGNIKRGCHKSRGLDVSCFFNVDALRIYQEDNAIGKKIAENIGRGGCILDAV